VLNRQAAVPKKKEKKENRQAAICQLTNSLVGKRLSIFMGQILLVGVYK
jgi:hypothetical protein